MKKGEKAKTLIMMSYFLILFFCLLATSLCEESCQVPMENFNGGLVHPLLEQMKNVNIKRYKDFDEEDMDTYMQVQIYNIFFPNSMENICR